MFFRKILLIGCLLVGAMASRAQADDRLMWWAEGQPGSQHAASLDAGQLRTLLQEVLVRVTGTAAVLATPEVGSLLAAPDKVVSSHSIIAAHHGSPARLVVEFSSEQLTPLLEKAGFPVWSDRPRLLVLWVQGTQLQAMPTTLSSEFMAEAHQRGLLLAKPVQDDPGAMLMPAGSNPFAAPAQLWLGLAVKSGVAGVLLVTMATPGNRSQVDWRVITDHQDRQFSVQVDDVLSFWPFLADQVSEVLVGKHHWPAAQGAAMQFDISDVHSEADFAGLMVSLRRQGMTDLKVRRIQGDHVEVLGLPGAAGVPITEGHLLLQDWSGFEIPKRWKDALLSGCPWRAYRWQSGPVAL